MDFEPFGYGHRWFDRLEARRRRGILFAAIFGIIAALVVVLNWVGA